MRVDGGLCGTSDGLHAGRESVEEEMEEEEAKAKAWGSEESRSTLETATSQTLQELISISPSFSLPFPLSPSHRTMPTWPNRICSPSLTVSLTLPLRWLVIKDGRTFPTKRNRPCQQQIDGGQFWRWHTDARPTQMSGTFADAVENSKQPERDACELFKYCTNPSGLPEELWDLF